MKIQFVKNYSDCKIPTLPCDSYVLYRDDDKNVIPNIDGVKDSIPFSKFRKIYPSLHTNLLIIFGLNRLLTPSNRCDFVFEHLHNLSHDVKKMSIDTSPFIGEPWRVWFHYGTCHCGKFGVPYSYSIETEWKHWFYREVVDSRFNNIEKYITDTYTNLNILNYSCVFNEVTKNDYHWYEEAKKFIFEKYNTPKLLINNLLKMANKKFLIKYGMDSYKDNSFGKFLPDLPIYRFIDEENKRRLSIYNKIIIKAKEDNESI